MATYDNPNNSRSYDNTQRRLTRVRARIRRQRRFAFVLAVLFVVVVLPLLVLLQRSSPPPAPLLILTWPKPKVRQIMASGSHVVIRPGSSFEVTVSDAEKWNCHWSAPGVETNGASSKWALIENTSTLTVRCRPVVSGWQRFTAWLWPAHEMKLHGVIARPAGDYREKIVPPASGVWVYPHILARTPLTWDERALKLLVAPLLPALDGTLSLSVPTTAPPQETPESPAADKALWTLVRSFSEANASSTTTLKSASSPNSTGSANTQPTEPVDPGTYALLSSSNPKDDLPRVAQLIAQAETAPEASIKFVVRLDTKRPQGIFRIAFDGKHERAAWIKNAGQTQGTPLRWWKDEKRDDDDDDTSRRSRRLRRSQDR